MALYFRNPLNGYVEKVYGLWSFLWAFLFGPLYFLYKGAWPHTLVLFLIGAFLFTRGDIMEILIMIFVALGYAAASRAIVRRVYLRKGWTEIAGRDALSTQQPRIEPAVWSNDRRV